MRRKTDGILTVRDHIESFIERAKKTIDLEAVILFGSRVKAENLECSDVDLLVVSSSFEGMAPFRRSELLLSFWTGTTATDPVGFSPAELMNTESLIVFDVLEFGKPLFDRGIFSEARKRFREKKHEGRINQLPGGWAIRQ